jgi:DUF4097 and DUF4098 domain-containing protein YvlB
MNPMKTLVLLLAGLTAATLARAESFPAAEKFSQTYAVSAQAELSLNNINGSVEIVAWDKNEIAVDAEKRAANSDDLAKIHIDVDASPTRVEIKTNHDRTRWFFNNVNGSVHYTIHVPATLALCNIHVVNSTITIDDVHGQIKAHTVNGGVHVTGITTFAELNTVNGNIDATLAPDKADQVVTASTVNGSCRLSLPVTLAATIHGQTVNGNIKCALTLTDLESSRRSIDGRIGAGDKGKIDVSTVNGGITFNAL